MSVSLIVRLKLRGFSFALPPVLVVLGFMIVLAGCVDHEKPNATGSSDRGDQSLPSLDARGGTSDSSVQLGGRTLLEGTGGNGGSIRVTTSGGNITMNAAQLATPPQATSLLGNGFDVAPGEKRSIAGSQVVNWLRVQAGGTLVLLEDTLFVVLGDVEIAGYVNGRGDKHAIDGRDFTVDADGIVNITGKIDTSGYESDPNDVSPQERVDLPGGYGGEIYISSAEDSAGLPAGLRTPSPGPHIFLTGTIRSEGGDSFSLATATARPGNGGQVLLGGLGSIAIGGRVSVHGGSCYFNTEGAEGDGGTIQIVALGNIDIARVRELAARGGNSSGTGGGDGGTILLEAPVGALDLDNFDIESRGGHTTFTTAGTGGEGGLVTLTSASVLLSGMTIDTSGGDAIAKDRGQGGLGGTTQIAGTTAITVAPDVVINSDGGQTNASGLAGGGGGNVKVVNINEASGVALDFQGAATVEGGKDAINSAGPDGEVCASGSNIPSSIKLSGTNNFPLVQCTATDVEDLVTHDLDCDDGTIRPDTVSTALPAITGAAFYRLFMTAGMVADSITTVTVTLTGETGGNVNLYAGLSAVLGSTDPGDYLFSSTEADSDETLDVDVSTLAAGEFHSIFIDEAYTFVEEYTISVSCDP